MITGPAGNVLPRDVQDELQRLGERWRTLPLAQALSYAGPVRALAQSLADRVAAAQDRAVVAVPDLGPGVLLDQVRVLAYYAAVAGLAEGLAGELAALLRALALLTPA